MTPHKQMTEWDNQGVPYHVTDISWSSGIGGDTDTSFAVVHHSEHWLLLRYKGTEMWVNIAHVMNMKVERL